MFAEAERDEIYLRQTPSPNTSSMGEDSP
jgi:hypothetical protein